MILRLVAMFVAGFVGMVGAGATVVCGVLLDAGGGLGALIVIVWFLSAFFAYGPCERWVARRASKRGSSTECGDAQRPSRAGEHHALPGTSGDTG